MSSSTFIPHAFRHGQARGFTLVEMIITLTIFVLLSAMVFGIITGVLQSTAILEQNQNHGDQILGLRDFLKKRLIDLPGASTIVSYRRGDGEGLDQNGIIFGTAGFVTAIDAKVQPNGLYGLRLATFSSSPGVDATTVFEQAIVSNDSSLQWTSLIQDAKTVKWQFQDFNVIQWVDLWNNPSRKPNLVELSFQLGGDLRPSIMDFWIPPIFTPPSILLPATSPANAP